MPLPPNSKYLVDTLQALPLLDGRFEGMRIVNVNSIGDERRGCFSLVFWANDLDTGKPVALKFFDPQRTGDTYRIAAFRREHEILQQLLGSPNCLQLESGLNTYQLPIPTPTGLIVTLPCEYFAIEWVPEEIDDYFLRQQNFSVIDRLYLYCDIVKSVSALHAREVFHRDLKADNIRSDARDGVRTAVPIDMGTAARYESAMIESSYAAQVGALGYASPEAQCGLAGNRKVARLTDYYALGCMLFELFNQDYFFHALRRRNGNYDLLLAAMRALVDSSGDQARQLASWNQAMDRLANTVLPVPIAGPGSDVPPGVAPILNEVLAAVTHTDLRSRPKSLEWVRSKIGSAIRALQNERDYQRRLAHTREMRRRRVERARQREARLLQHPNHVQGLPC
jgi:serine/threonine protein kinase